MDQMNPQDTKPELLSNKKLLVAAIAGILALSIIAGAYYLIRIKQVSLSDESTRISQTDATKDTQNITEDFEQLPPEYGTQFSLPYSIEWSEGGVTFTLTGASLGKMKTPPSPTQTVSPIPTEERSYFLKRDGGYYTVGEELYALTLNLKIKTGQSTSTCVPLNIRLAIDGDDFIAPLQKQFYFPYSGGCRGEPNVTYENQSVSFEVSPNDKDFKIYRFTTGGAAYLSFTLHFNESDEFSVEKVLLESPSPQRPTGGGVTTSTTPNIRLVSPAAPVTIQRGEPLQLTWDFVSENVPNISRATARIFLRSNTDPTISQYLGALLTEKRESLYIQVPPGSYTLEFTSSSLTPNALKQTVSVEVTGQQPTISAKGSYFYLDTETEITGRIIADGACGIIAIVLAADEFEYPIANPQIEIRSDRGIVDTITPLSTSATDDPAFLITSKTIGIAKLQAYVNGVVLTEVLVIQVLDPANNACPDDSNYYNNRLRQIRL